VLSPLLALAALGWGYATPRAESADLMELDPDAPRHRAAQTRLFETRNGIELLSASAAALQDLGFQIEESVPELGFLRAAKERGAREYGQEISRVLLLLTGNQIPVDMQQKIAASLIAQPLDGEEGRYAVRIMFYRAVWKGDGSRSKGGGESEYIPPGIQRMEMIRSPEIYQQFFARLSQAVFLEAHTI
jgi:hypothetical protein